MKILADASLPNVSALFEQAFDLTLYNTQDEAAVLVATHDILLCRSTLKVTKTLLADTPIRCVATASSGVDHIDEAYLNAQGIKLFDAKGSNAPAVADYVVATLALLSRKNVPLGKRAGIIGLGEVGSRVFQRLNALGFEVICYDPLKAQVDNCHDYCSLEDLNTCDVLCIHANLHEQSPYPSANLLDKNFLKKLKPNTVIINAARGGIVNEDDLLKTTTPLTYCTDVYQNEPHINPAIVDFSFLCTPHIAGHSQEAKIAAVKWISDKLHLYCGFSQAASITSNPTQHTCFTQYETWEENILKLYNPLNDTLSLKAALNKELAFLTQRTAHQNRHNFSAYECVGFDQLTRKLMGIGASQNPGHTLFQPGYALESL